MSSGFRLQKHVTCLSFSAWQCNRRCKLILDCGKHQCKKSCCTKLKRQCFTVYTRLLAVACTVAIGPVIRADATRVSWKWCITLLSRAENELKCNQQCENTMKNDAVVSVLGIECLNVSQLSLNCIRRLITFCESNLLFVSSVERAFMQLLYELQSKREQTAAYVTQQMYPSKSKCQKILSITVRQDKQQKPTRLDLPRPDVPLTHQGHQVQCDWLA
ncbi:hypothetical protein T07_10607 [Trichinella nelsoni]|uniref:Uncharacterized protein n=1 Tax=Trichinella nelsoni TaxID=6336 RepID=A0A0V0RSH0_9BILA|nr:hypothetical protein T07_10607 [Trichinella nelsoni]